jgi:hypothetical protein
MDGTGDDSHESSKGKGRNMSARAWAAMIAAAAALVVGFGIGEAEAGGLAPTAGSGSLTVHYEQSYSITFVASDPEGDSLTLVTPPANSDLIGCDNGPADNFTCEYSSSRYDGSDPLPTAPFQRTISYSVSDGTSTATGVWTVTVLPPPTMEITGHPSVVEGEVAQLRVELSSDADGDLMVPAHLEPISADGGATGPFAPFAFSVADGEDSATVSVAIPDDSVRQIPRRYRVVVDRLDAIPYRFVDDGNAITVRDNDGPASDDVNAPTVAAHRDLKVVRGGRRSARPNYTAPTATDDVDGTLPSTCAPASGTVFSPGTTKVTCTATDKAGNSGTGGFNVNVRRVDDAGVADVFGRRGAWQCVNSGRPAWVATEGFAAKQTVTIGLQTAGGDVIPVGQATTDKHGRVRALVIVPDAPTGDADMIVTGLAGPKDLQVMIPVHVRGRHVPWRALTFYAMSAC